MKSNFIQIKEASQILGVSKLTLRNWDNKRKLISYRHPINNYRIYNKKDIYKLLNLIKKSPIPQNRKNGIKNGVYKLKVVHLKD
jgi:hypothetical protein